MGKKRNSFIEIFRLLASFWVCYYHGISLIERGAFFSNGRIAVDFFFILSGLFLFNSMKKYDDLPLFKGSLRFIYGKFKPLMVTFLICFVFSLISFFSIEVANGELAEPWGYLWYIPHLMVVEWVLYVVRRLVKKDYLFLILIGVASCVCLSLTLTFVSNYGLVRGFGAVPLGIFLSLIPEIKMKHRNFVTVPATILIFATIFLVSYFYPSPKYEDHIMILLLFPSLLYFAKQSSFSCPYVNAICAISLGMYCYQEIVSYFEDLGILSKGWVMFLIVAFFACVDVVCKNVFYLLKQKKATQRDAHSPAA